MKVSSAVFFLEKAENSSIYVYYTDLDKSEKALKISAVYQKFADVFNEKAENLLSPH